jgi:tetratricopeptide (TPR) repeat protein
MAMTEAEKIGWLEGEIEREEDPRRLAELAGELVELHLARGNAMLAGPVLARRVALLEALGDREAAEAARAQMGGLRELTPAADEGELTPLVAQLLLLESTGKRAEADVQFARVRAAVEALGDHPERALVESILVAWLASRGRGPEAEAILRAGVLRAAGKTPGPLAERLSTLGLFLTRQGRPDEAREIFARALPLAEVAFGDGPHLAPHLEAAAEAHDALEELPEVERLRRRLLAIHGRGAPDDPKRLAARDALVTVLRRQGKETEAAAVLGESSGPEARGDLAYAARRYDEAAAAYTEALDGAPVPAVEVALLRKLIDVHRATQRYGDVEALMGRLTALGIQLAGGDIEGLRGKLAEKEATVGADSAETVEVAARLASALFLADRGTEARPVIERLLDTLRRHGAERHPHAGELHDWLGRIAAAEGDLDAAERHFEQSAGIAAQVAGPGDLSVAARLRVLEDSFLSANLLERALPIHRRVVAILDRALGPAHPDVLTYRRELAVKLLNRGGLDQAVELLTQVLVEEERGAAAPETIIELLETLAFAERKLHRLDRVVEHYLRVAVLRRQAAGDVDTEGEAEAWSLRAAVLLELGDGTLAEEALRRALALQQAVLPAGDERIRATAARLEQLAGRPKN